MKFDKIYNKIIVESNMGELYSRLEDSQIVIVTKDIPLKLTLNDDNRYIITIYNNDMNSSIDKNQLIKDFNLVESQLAKTLFVDFIDLQITYKINETKILDELKIEHIEDMSLVGYVAIENYNDEFLYNMIKDTESYKKFITVITNYFYTKYQTDEIIDDIFDN